MLFDKAEIIQVSNRALSPVRSWWWKLESKVEDLRVRPTSEDVMGIVGLDQVRHED